MKAVFIFLFVCASSLQGAYACNATLHGVYKSWTQSGYNPTVHVKLLCDELSHLLESQCCKTERWFVQVQECFYEAYMIVRHDIVVYTGLYVYYVDKLLVYARLAKKYAAEYNQKTLQHWFATRQSLLLLL